jgi:hypothetical protein
MDFYGSSNQGSAQFHCFIFAKFVSFKDIKLNMFFKKSFPKGVEKSVKMSCCYVH